MQSPCQDCPHRKVTCHDRCEEYLEYHDALVNAKRSLADAYTAVDYLIRMADKRAKKARVRRK